MKRLSCILLAILLCVNCFFITASAKKDISSVEIFAQELKELGLFKGVSDTNFDLGRAPSRVEALVMLIRVLGKENEVNSSSWGHPFSDVPAWANNYIGYAYSNGLTNGQSATEFGTGDASSAMYLTFVLRALGYSDTNGKDFDWQNPFSLATHVGILSADVDIHEFWRADVVLVSHSALSACLNGSTETLAEKLISMGVFTQAKFDSIYNKSGKNLLPAGEFTAEEIYETCSPAVFYIEIYDNKGTAVSSGSGFFIDNKGTAVTNYHVIDGAYSAAIQLSDTKDVYGVLGVYDYNAEEDWAIIKVDCTGNKYLPLASNSKVVGGATVYAIGSPLGLQNTISTGIVSNPARVADGVTYIQTNAAISHGSSGGALLNTKGEVIGITSAGYADGQNLNLALPISYINGFNKKEVTPFRTLYLEKNQQDEIVDGINQTAFNLLAQFIVENYDSIDDSNGYVLSLFLSHDADEEDGEDAYELTYYPEKNRILVHVSYVYTSSQRFSYMFNIDSSESETFAMYWYYDYDRYYEAFEEDSTGKARFASKELSEDYTYEFYEYSGYDRTTDERIASHMHQDGLDFINFIFEEYLYQVGCYSVADLGYSAY